jgi:GDP-D-mannose dehydratase
MSIRRALIAGITGQDGVHLSKFLLKEGSVRRRSQILPFRR